ncbi:MAG: hypothetical protein WBA84_11400 [Carnobacterium sp.]|uniref:hypothetical protein n=1 Tax=Carnobacterium sp. TaxID=48221 RepID=UPI003C725241
MNSIGDFKMVEQSWHEKNRCSQKEEYQIFMERIVSRKKLLKRVACNKDSHVVDEMPV